MLTIEMWIHPTVGNTGEVLVKQGAYSFPVLAGGSVLDIALETAAGKRKVGYYDTNRQYFGKQLYFACSYDGTLAIFYVNGVEQTRHVYPTSLPIKVTNGALRIGKPFGSVIQQHFGGILFQVKITRTVLDCLIIQKGNCKSKYAK